MKISEIISQYNIPTAPEHHHHSREGWIQIDCPWCTKNARRWRLGIPEQGWICNCWSCGVHTLIDTLVEITNESYVGIKRLVDTLDFHPSRKGRREELKGNLILPSGLGPLLTQHKNYLKERGFNPNKLEKLWKLQGIGLAENLAWRIFIPITYKGEVVSWSTRAIVDDVDRRYINAKSSQEKFSLKKVLYGGDLARHCIIVVEGPADAWRIGPGAVATLGVGYTKAQLLKISKYPVRVIAFDSEPDAQKRASELCNALSVFPGNTKNLVVSSKDPGEISEKEVKLLRRSFLE